MSVHHPFQFFSNIFGVLLFSAFLGACSSYEGGETIDLTVGGQHRVEEVAQSPLDTEGQDPVSSQESLVSELKTVESNKRAQIVQAADSVEDPSVQRIPSLPPPKDADLMTITDKLSGKSVEIFDLDAPLQPRQQKQRKGSGLQSAIDPRVTVYPIEGGASGTRQVDGRTREGSFVPVIGSLQNPALRGQVFRGNDSLPSISALTQSSGPGFRGQPTGKIFFGYGSSQITDKGKTVIGLVSNDEHPALTVEGFSSKKTQTKDPVKAKIGNLRQSMLRAYEVSKALIHEGVPADQIKTVAWGDSKATDNEAESRRVDILIGHH